VTEAFLAVASFKRSKPLESKKKFESSHTHQLKKTTFMVGFLLVQITKSDAHFARIKFYI